MYVCVCNGVTERQIERAVQTGAARMRDLRLLLGVSAECGKCADCAQRCLRSALSGQEAGTATVNCMSNALQPSITMLTGETLEACAA